MNRSSCLSEGGWVAFSVVFYLESSLVRLSFLVEALVPSWRNGASSDAVRF